MPEANRELDTLMIAAQAGDTGAYHALLRALAVLLRAYFARRMGRDAAVEDLVQDTLIAIHERRATYDPARPFAPWLYAIARYRLIDHLRASKTRAALSLTDAEAVAGDAAEDATEARLDIERLLAHLPERSREIVRRVKIEGRSVAEASADSGVSATAIRVLLHRAIRTMAARANR
ncbi:sigma-70 family RNA polymerase sigma factor [Xanthobacter sp. V3C-3]|uniref:sigma-70 family RNA polymerase sigma factor n=1 Tax=Xanthobacter lutulentifluminis TaxID=3119935 RepID=UPI00372AE4B1